MSNIIYQPINMEEPTLQYDEKVIDPVARPDEYWKSQRKCLRCFKLYTEEENHAEDSRCYYHPGSYTDPEDVMKGTLVGWSCCSQISDPTLFFNKLNPLALEYDSKGCKVKRYHKEDVEYTKNLVNFPFNATLLEQKEETPALPPLDLSQIDSLNLNELDDNPHFFRHYVSLKDTLVGISMKYDIPAGIIQRVNRLPTQQIFERKFLYVPKTKDHQDAVYPPDILQLDNDRLKTKFMSKTKCSREEATFYLEETDFNFEEALLLFEDDEKWNKQQLVKNGPALNPTNSKSKNRLC